MLPYTLRKAGVRVDTGLGLPSCKIMAKALSADLIVESDGRTGRRFACSCHSTRRPDRHPSDRDDFPRPEQKSTSAEAAREVHAVAGRLLPS